MDGGLALTARRGVVKRCGADAALIHQALVNGGSPVSASALATFVGLTEAEAEAAIQRLLEAGLVKASGYVAVDGAVR